MASEKRERTMGKILCPRRRTTYATTRNLRKENSVEEQKFELELRMSEEGIVCNAKALEAMLPEKLKPYNYVVTINNYQDAKKDRTKLNNLVKVLQTKRKQFEDTELIAWKDAKAALMRIEKIISEASDNLASGIRDIDEKEKIAKMEEVRDSFDLINLPILVTFDKLYDRSVYDKKSMSVKNIMEDMQLKIDRINRRKNSMAITMQRKSWRLLKNPKKASAKRRRSRESNLKSSQSALSSMI